MRVAFGTAEMAPFAHVGGLGDVSRWLPANLAAGGDDVRVFLPRYDVLDLAGCSEEPVPGLGSLDLGDLGTVSVSELRGTGATVYLVAAPHWFERGGIYAPGSDEHMRYAALCAALIAVCDRLEWRPDVIHANDWHTALLPLHADAAGGGWSDIPVVLTLHNVAFQGWFDVEIPANERTTAKVRKHGVVWLVREVVLPPAFPNDLRARRFGVALGNMIGFVDVWADGVLVGTLGRGRDGERVLEFPFPRAFEVPVGVLADRRVTIAVRSEQSAGVRNARVFARRMDGTPFLFGPLGQVRARVTKVATAMRTLRTVRHVLLCARPRPRAPPAPSRGTSWPPRGR